MSLRKTTGKDDSTSITFSAQRISTPAGYDNFAQIYYRVKQISLVITFDPSMDPNFDGEWTEAGTVVRVVCH